MSRRTLAQATGTAEYFAKAKSIRDDLEAQIPAALRLPASILENLPLDVTGIPASCGLLTAEELVITELDATAVCEKIAKGQLTAVETATAFGKRAAIAHQLVACLTDFYLDEAIARAKELDEYYKREGKVIGPLHGLPISVKDCYRVKGRRGSGGFLANVEISTKDAALITVLRSLGAVFYCKTNQPQTIMHLETHSFYGRTLNPHNIGLTSGGSSGGEAALIAMKGSCLGVGSDGGGSIRGPAANVGIYGIRTTASTLPYEGQIWYQNGQGGFGTSTGPLARSARDITTFLDAVHGARPSTWDFTLIPQAPVPLQLGGRKLRVGVMLHDGVVVPHPPMLRALQMAKAKLLAAPNIEVVDYVPHQHDRGYTIVRKLYFPDGGQRIRKLLAESGEDALPLTDWVISPPITTAHSTSELWELVNSGSDFRKEYSEHWLKSGCDVLLCAPLGGCASPHDTARYWGYTAIWNLLDYPGFAFPSGLKADPAVDVVAEKTAPLSPADEENQLLYVPKDFVNAPISLQLVARRFDDGLLIAAQKIVEEIVRA